MKKYLSYLGASLVAIAALSSCNKELADPNEGTTGAVPFEISASSIDTRTENDGLSTKWVAGDAINLFHAAAGTTTYKSDGQFTITSENLAANKFTGTLAAELEAGNYDWYAFYPYDSHISTPASTSSGYVTVGGTSQAQTGNNSTAHLCGKTCPLYGVASAVASDVTPSIKMNHLTSIVEVNVTNNSGNELTVSSVSFTGTEDIVGTYYINFTKTPVVYTSSGKNYVSNTASLGVTDGEAIANGSSAKFYIAIKPFTVSSGVLKVAVNGYEKEITISKKTVFTAGKIKKINFDFNATQTTYIWDLSIDSTTEATAEKIAWTNSVADMVCIKGESSNPANNYYPGASNRTSTRFYANSTLSITPKTGKSLTYYVFEATSENYATALANSTWTNAMVNAVGTTVTVIAADPSKAVSAVIGATCGFTRVECHTDEAPVFAPIIRAEPTSINAPAAGDVCTINYSIDFPVDGKSISATSDQDWVHSFNYSTTGEISFVVDANTGDARTATVSLSYEGAENVLITVSQNSASTGSVLGDPYSWTLVSGDLGTTGSPLATVTKGSPELSWNASYNWPSGATKYLGWDTNTTTAKGVQIGSGSATNKCNSLVLSSTKYSGTVSTIVVNGAIASSGNTTVTVNVNGTALKCGSSESASLTTSASAYTFTTDTPIGGTIEIKFTNSANKAFYIKL